MDVRTRCTFLVEGALPRRADGLGLRRRRFGFRHHLRRRWVTRAFIFIFCNQSSKLVFVDKIVHRGGCSVRLTTGALLPNFLS